MIRTIPAGSNSEARIPLKTVTADSRAREGVYLGPESSPERMGRERISPKEQIGPQKSSLLDRRLRHRHWCP